MSSTVNYDDLYEEFIRLTSSPKPEQRVSEVSPVAQAVVEVIKIKYEINDSLEKSPLRVLTPPSPISLAPPPTPCQGPSTGFTFISSPDYFEGERMCDSSQGTTAPTIVISGQGNVPVTSVGKQLSVEGSSISSNLNNGQTFITGLLPTTMIQQTQQHNNNLTPIHGHGHALGNVGMETQQQQQQSASAMHSPMHSHSIQGNSCSAIQYHLMDNHHHVQQINLSHQHGTHQVPHGPPHPASHSHHPLAHNSHNSQQFVPFGMHLNANNVGNGNTYANHQVNPFHVHHGPQIPNQQPAHTMNMGLPLQQTCFMQHATCMHYQQNSQSLATLTPQRASGAVGWMTGPPGSNASQNQNAINTNSHDNGTNLGTCVSVQQDGAKVIQTPKGQPPTLSDPATPPGGLEILWRELPVDCQRLMVPQDIPDSARFRGYFTVCELLVLKRALENRYVGAVKMQAGMPTNSKSKPQINKILGTTGGRVNKSKESGKRGSKRAKKEDRNTRKGGNTGGKNRGTKESGKHQPQVVSGMPSNNDGGTENCNNELMQEDDNSISGEVMISLEGMKGEIHTKISPAVTGVGVGGAVKAAIEALTSGPLTTTGQSGNGDDQSSSRVTKENDITLLTGKDSDTDELVLHESANANPTHPVAVVVATSEAQETGSSQLLGDMNYSKEISTSELAVLPLLPSMSTFSGLFSEKKDTAGEESSSLVSTSTSSNTSASTQIIGDGKDVDDASTESQKQLVLALNSITSDTAASSINSLSNTIHHINNSIAPGVGCCAPVQVPVENRYSSGPPPPYRTATLVIKLLQIGAYHIRSFSAVNPNRLRVLFNTQRMTYECQLPATQDPNSNSGSNLVRKVLTVDIGFEQISMLKFGPDSLWMRVEGAPLLTIAVNPAPEESVNQRFSPQDYFVLDQIEKGQLKLSPIHQLYFLNERLVNLLESQFREHPRFSHLLMCATR